MTDIFQKSDEPNEAAYERLLNRLKQDPLFELRQELGKFLFRHIDSLTPQERKRYDGLLNILTNPTTPSHDK